MTIFEFAKKMELDGEQYYRSLAMHCAREGLRKILEGLADDEVKHFHVLERMEEGADPVLTRSELLATAKNIFAAIKKEDVAPESSAPDVNEYRKALDIELRSQVFYEQKAAESQNPLHKELFLQIADQERRHYILIDSMIELLLRPFTWLENAEWRHIDEY